MGTIIWGRSRVQTLRVTVKSKEEGYVLEKTERFVKGYITRMEILFFILGKIEDWST